MTEWLKLNNEQKIEVFEQIRTNTGIPLQAIEKDWWVTQTLRLIFEMECAASLLFKGGTFLSKAWNLIDRFSEDIDLALDRKFLNFGDVISATQVEKLRTKSSHYISSTFFEVLKEKFATSGFDNMDIQLAEVQNNDPIIIVVNYKSVFGATEYIQPRVLVEVGSRSMREPFTDKLFCSLVGVYFKDKDFADAEIIIRTVNPERTFLEKIFLLHEEFQKPGGKIRVDRLSRHLYDIEKMMDTPYSTIALRDMELYNEIVEHRRIFTRVGGINYALHSPDKINPIPPDEIIAEWKKDYETMQESMIYKPSLSFNKLIERIQLLKERINAIKSH